MKLIVGLGNPGRKYEDTRHNAGYWVVERFAAETRTVLRKEAKFQALVGRHESSGAWLLLPETFMNTSGRPVQLLASFFRIAPSEIIVVHDELDFPPGVARIKQGGGIAGHNGLKDISARLGSHDYWRLRIGVGHPGDKNAVTDYVLHKPTQDERAAIDGAIGRALEALPLVLGGDTQGAMLKLHTGPEPVAAERPVKPEPARPPRAEAVEKKKPRQAERPEKPDKAGKPGRAGKAEPEEKTAKPEKAGILGSLLKRLLPEQDPARKK
ncbi:MAG: aminoacyl-tRNA hydrolase [Betaproteobacteria bacterium]|nr:aminoacyl-tRNA hydrolase [Betaproteobacteria bacterium]